MLARRVGGWVAASNFVDLNFDKNVVASPNRSMVDPILQRLLTIDPTQFENLIFECLRAKGMANLVWRTPGADGGRDIEGAVFDRDLAGATDVRRWYVECKRYNSSLDWPTVRGKVAYAESNDADFLLVATTTNPSPQCENEISKWNSAKRRPLIRFWRGYDLPNIIRCLPDVAVMFGLIEDKRKASSSLLPLAEVSTRLAQATYTRYYFNQSDVSSIEAVAAVSELFSVRLKDVLELGRPAVGPLLRGRPMFEWLQTEVDVSGWEPALACTYADKY
jgi:hypothetical protein